MNDWYQLTNALETDVPPIDELSRKRILKKVKASLPCRKKYPQLIAVIAAILLLSACGYAMVTGQFSSWFWQVAEDPTEPESSEELLSSIGTVIGQSQTVDGITVTLDGAIWDGNAMILSLTLSGDAVSAYPLEQVQSESSYLCQTEAQIRKTLPLELPYLTEERIDEIVEHYLANREHYFSHLEITSYQVDEANRYALLIKDEYRSSLYSANELTLHLENLEFQGKTVAGPFDFTFAVEQKDVTDTYTGRKLVAEREDYDIYITGAEVSPFRIKVTFETSVPLSEEQYDSEAIHSATVIDHIQVNGEEFRPSSSWGGSQGREDDGYVRGSSYTGSFDRIVDPSEVEAIRIGGVWLELNELELAESE